MLTRQAMWLYHTADSDPSSRASVVRPEKQLFTASASNWNTQTLR